MLCDFFKAPFGLTDHKRPSGQVQCTHCQEMTGANAPNGPILLLPLDAAQTLNKKEQFEPLCSGEQVCMVACVGPIENSAASS